MQQSLATHYPDTKTLVLPVPSLSPFLNNLLQPQSLKTRHYS